MGRQTGTGTVHIDGYKELRRDLAELSGDVDTMLKALNTSVADDIIQTAQSRAAAVGRQQTRAAAQMKPYRSARAGGVNLRATARVPYALGAEFGAKRPQFKPWRGNGVDAGYFLWPSIRSTNVMQHYSDGLAAIIEEFNHG